MKKFVFILALNLLTLGLSAQNFKTASSEIVEENIGQPVLLMKDGTTIFFNVEEKDKSCSITAFDAQRKKTYTKPLVFTKFKNTEVNSAYYRNHIMDESNFVFREMNGKVVVFVQTIPQGKYDMLYNQQKYRLVIDPASGKVESEEMVSMEKSTVTRFFDEAGSSGYCIVSNKTNFRKKDQPKPQLNIKYYSKAHKLVNELDYNLGEYTDFKNVGAYYSAKNQLVLINVMTTKNDEKKMVISRVDLDSKSTESKELFNMNRNYEKNQFLDNISLNINPLNGTDQLNVCYYITARTKSDQIFYDISFQNITIGTLEASEPFSLGTEKLDAFVKEKCDISEGYKGGMLTSVNFDESGNMFTTRAKNVVSASGNYIQTQNPELLGMSTYEKTGKELSSAAVPYNCTGTTFRSMTIKTGTDLNDFTFRVVNAGYNYLLLNDLEKNKDIPLNEKPAFAKTTDECNAMVVLFNNDGSVKKEYLFGAPVSKKQNNYADFHQSLYDAGTKTFVCTYYEGKGFKKKKVAWVTFQ